MNYIEVYFQTGPVIAEILLAELANYPYDTFEENEKGLKAYIPEKEYDESVVLSLTEQYGSLGEIAFETQLIPRENWNEKWEKNFHPIRVSDQILVRADFHEPDDKVPYEIVIAPKMSFGTGHHDTTAQMLRYQIDIDHEGKTVLDAGTGTGILAIMADKRKAGRIMANDIDDWCIDNSRENFTLNSCRDVDLRLGPIIVFNGEQADILIANINKNVLLKEIPAYADIVTNKGTLLLSGFYESDIPDLEEKLNAHGFQKVSHTVSNKWAAVRCIKTD
ncbi:MAG: 50S ribosomal protein L11 methyltransferase [Cyclobacteriaceae bacterium]